MLLKQLNLDLNGTFALTHQDGFEVQLSSARCKAILAVLATSPKGKRSREWLKTAIWPRSGEPQCSYSLRNALSSLRRLNATGMTFIEADRSCVWIKNINLVPLNTSDTTPVFEDAPTLGEEFEDWLRDLRLHGQVLTVPTLDEQARSTEAAKPVIAINLPVIQSDDGYANVVVAALCDQIVSSIRNQDLVSVLDLRDTVSDQMRSNQLEATSPTALVNVELFKYGAHARLSLSLSVTNPQTGQVMWNASIGADQCSKFLLSGDNILEFVCMSTDSILNAVLSNTEKGQLRPTLISSVHQIMSMSPDVQQSARQMLRKSKKLETSAVANAWYALSIANSVGERDGASTLDLLDEAQAHCAYALEKDRSNPIVLCLVSHVFGFLFRSMERAGDLAARSRAQGQFLPIVWDLSAMNALYRNQPSEAVQYGLKAAKLSRYSPYRHFFL